MFTTLFLVILLAITGTKVWLNKREVRHVSLHRDEVPVSFAGQVSLEAHQLAADYTTANLRVSTLEALCAPLWLIGVTLLGGLQFFSEALLRLFGPGYSHGIALVACVILIPVVMGIPFGLYRRFGIDQRYGFNRTTWRLWLADAVKVALLGTALLFPLVFAALWLMEKTGGLWWLCLWALWATFLFVVNLIFPTCIAPLFNKFAPLADGELRQRVEALLARCGFASNGAFVADGSRRSTQGNAYFTGLGKSKRIVFYDTLLEQLNTDEIEAVLAHELGHFHHRHVRKQMVLALAAAFISFAALGWMATQPWFYIGMGVAPGLESARAPVTLSLLLLISPLLLFFLEPLINAISRRFEFEADAFAISTTGHRPLISALVKLYDSNGASLTTDPIRSAFYDSHPPIVRRIEQMHAQIAGQASS